jgi:hypothetical protein
MNNPNRVFLSRATCDALRTYSQIQGMRDAGYTVGKTFTQPVKRQPALHTVAQKQTAQESARQCAAELCRFIVPVLLATVAFLILI